MRLSSSSHPRNNPGSIYVEVQNYFVKSFAGWNNDGKGGGGPTTDADLARAKKMLARFDMVLLVSLGKS